MFQTRWLGKTSWLEFNKEDKYMTYKLCIKHNKGNVFTGKNTHFKNTTLTRHTDPTYHNDAVYAESVHGKLHKSVEKVLSEKEAAYSLLELFSELNCPRVSDLDTVKNITCSSDKAAVDMLSALACVLRAIVDQSLLKSTFTSLVCDESTGIGVHKTFVIYARVLDTYTYKPSALVFDKRES